MGSGKTVAGIPAAAAEPFPRAAGPWEPFADMLLQRAALVARVDRNRGPDPLAGLKVDDDDVAALLAELPGLETDGVAAGDRLHAALEDHVAEARALLHEAVAAGADRFASLAHGARLAAPDVEVLAVVCAVEADPRRQRLVGYLHDDVTLRRVTPWLLARLFATRDAPLEAVGPGGALRRAGLLAPGPDGPWGAAPLAVAPAVLWWLAGDDGADPDLPARVGRFRPAGEVPAGTPAEPPLLVTAAGPDRRRRLAGIAAALRFDELLVAFPPDGSVQWDALVRSATLLGLPVVLEVDGDLAPDVARRIEAATHLRWALSGPAHLPLSALPDVPWVEAEVADARATPAEWAARFPALPSPPFPLSADQLDQVARAADALGGDLHAAMRRLAAGHIDATAARIRPSRTWADLVLDPDREAQVREIAIRARHRETVFGAWAFDAQPSAGVVALFAGPSGTGKTLAAEIIAGDLGVDLYKIDLASLVSKYIGETEKNLSRVFETAEASNVVLFFDEADALLGKRSEVSDAHDRYANIEVAYLLQRLERYEGVAVMATNLARNIDDAFLRRIHVIVEFPVPEPPERRRIWARSVPAGAPVADDLDLDALADGVEISGGTIRNSVLTAAFLAAEAGTPITMELAVTAVRRELQKLGRLASAADFRSLGNRP